MSLLQAIVEVVVEALWVVFGAGRESALALCLGFTEHPLQLVAGISVVSVIYS